MGRKRNSRRKEGHTAQRTVAVPKPFSVKIVISLCDKDGKEYGPIISIVNKESPVSIAELAWEIANGTFAAIDELLHKRADILFKDVSELDISIRGGGQILSPMRQHRECVDAFTPKKEGGTYNPTPSREDENAPF